MAEILVKATAGIFFGTILTVFLYNFGLEIKGEQTVSQWLRLNPGWFWIPACGLAGIMIGLAIHLFWIQSR